MEITYSLLSTLNIIFLVQGLSFGFLLILLNKRQNRRSLFLGIFVLLFALTNTSDTLFELNVLTLYPKLEYLPFNFYWLLYPVFYLYVKDTSSFSGKRPYWILFPGIIEILVNSAVLCFNKETVFKITNSIWFDLYDLLGILFSLIVVFRTFRLVNKHLKVIKDQYTSLEYKELKWVKYFTIVILIYFGAGFINIVVLFTVLSNVVDDFIATTDIIYFFINVILLFWLVIKGFSQQYAPSLIKDESSGLKKSTVKDLILSDEETIESINLLKKLVKEEGLYKSVDLTIVDVSEKMNIHPKKLSVLLNSNVGLNFNQFINQYRIEDAKQLLNENKTNNLTIEGIAMEVGFKSKSSFYTAFKKVTNMTPVNFKNSTAN